MNDAALLPVLAGLAGLIALDATAALQLMVSQPLVAGALAGAVCGDLGTGLVAGAVLELIWLGALPVGAAAFPDASVGTVVGVGAACAVLRAGSGPGWAIPVGVVVALLVAEAGRVLVSLLRRWNIGLSDAARRAAQKGEAGGVVRAQLLGLSVRFVTGAALAFTALAVVFFVTQTVFAPGPRSAFPAFLWAAPMGAAVVAHRCGRMNERVLMAAGFMVGLVIVVAG